MAIKTDYLEDDYRPSYEAWRTTPTPQTAGALLDQLQPVIRGGVARFVGTNASPVLRSQAKRVALDAIQTYDPRQASLSTHVTNQLRSLNRINRQERQVLRVPERQSVDANFLHAATLELEDQLGRPPSTVELADRTGMSTKRIGTIRQLRAPVPEASFTGEDRTAPAVHMDRRRIITEAVYHDASPINQKIMEWTLGLHGQPPLDNGQIAARLRVTPGAISQRKAAIQAQLEQLAAQGVL